MIQLKPLLCKLLLMLKTQPLCTGAELNLRERVSSEVETSGKGGHSRSCIAMVQLWGADKIRVCAGPASFNLASVNLVMSFSGSFNLASGGLLWHEEC